MKRSISVIAIAALVGGVISVGPAAAQTEIPATVNIEDPFGDANGLGGDQVGPGDVGSVSDIGKIWFSNTADAVTVYMQTEAAPPATNGLVFQVFSNPGGDFPSPQGCLRFAYLDPGSTYAGAPMTKLIDRCNDEGTSFYDNGVEGETVIEELPDGTGLVAMTFPRAYSPLLADGASIVEPFGHTAMVVGEESAAGFASRMLDDTVLGSEYVLTSGGPTAGEPKKEPPGKADPPGKGKKKGCPKGKGKKKGVCPGKKKPKPPKPAACPAYAPGESGKDAPMTIVTDKATEEAPVVVELTASAGGPSAGPVDETSHVYQNVQVDSAAPEAGLWARIEFTNGHDYDLYLRHSDESAAANSGESQPVPGVGGGSEGGHEGGSNFEMITGMRTADCAGFTTDVVGFLTTGGAVTLSYWLGEIKFDPEPPGGEGQAMTLFYDLLGL